jgi:hypothetical protein
MLRAWAQLIELPLASKVSSDFAPANKAKMGSEEPISQPHLVYPLAGGQPART